MKKIILILFLVLLNINSNFAFCALSEDDFENFSKCLYVNEWQKAKIQEIQKNSEKEQQLYYKQLKGKLDSDKKKEIELAIDELKLKQDEEILKVLNIKQQFMYINSNS